jgi:hypothetical protein
VSLRMLADLRLNMRNRESTGKDQSSDLYVTPIVGNLTEEKSRVSISGFPIGL